MSYIDRNVIGIGYAKREMFIDPAYADGWNAAISILESTPDADVEPIRHGEWTGNTNGTFTCSKCGKRASRGRYCPNCGAKMDKEDT